MKRGNSERCDNWRQCCVIGAECVVYKDVPEGIVMINGGKVTILKMIEECKISYNKISNMNVMIFSRRGGVIPNLLIITSMPLKEERRKTA